MIRSMTGCAALTFAGGEFTVAVDIRAVNSRNLDLFLRLSPGDAAIEERIRALIAGRLARGRIEVKVQVTAAGGDAAAVEVDLVRARALMAALTRLREEFAFPAEPSLELLVGCGGVLKTAEAGADPERVWPAAEKALIQALDELEAMRRREGEHLARDLHARLASVEAALQEIAARAAGLTALIQQRLSERMALLLRGTVEIDPVRLAQEAAFLADRADISEEIVRAGSHLRQFRDIMAAPEAGGRKLNFLLQELNREFNTMGSKIGDADAAHRVVAVKSELEKIREQVQNVE
ncbi:MAG: YicC family protein [Desulfobacterales bacterium]|nr:YicC family protein [Desulfobacterales bacterium]